MTQKPALKHSIVILKFAQNHLCWMLIFVCLFSVGQKYDFRNYTTADGLNSGAILSVFQDDDQKLWIGSTEGINVFDGYEFINFNDEIQLPKRVVYSINKYNGNYFFGTAGGLCIYNKDTLITYNSTTEGHSDYVYCSFSDSKNNIWIGTETGLKFYSKGLKDTLVNSPLGSTPIYNIVEDRLSNLWFCTKSKGLFKYKNGKIKQFKIGNVGPYFVGDILQINDSTYWVAARSGLFKIVNNQVSPVQSLASNEASFYDLMKTSTGEIVLTSNEGVQIYKNNKFKSYSEKNGLLSNTILKVKEDKMQTLWFVSPKGGGLSQLVNKNLAIFDEDYLKCEGANSIIPKNEDEYYFSTPNGIVYHNTVSNEFKKINHSKDIEYNNGIYNKKTDELLVGTNKGIFVFKNDKITRQSLIKDYGELRKVFDIEIDENGVVWAATSGGIATIKNNELTYFNSENNIENYSISIFKSSKGHLYFGTDAGLLIYNGKTLTNYSKKHNFNVGRIRQIIEDHKGQIWLASDDGLFKQNKGNFELIHLKQYQNETIHSITFDEKNNLWIGLGKGVLKTLFTKKDTTIRFYHSIGNYEGLECNLNAIYNKGEDEIWFGTTDGIVQFLPGHDFEPKSVGKPNINLVINGFQNIEEYLDILPDGTKSYELPHGFNQIKFSIDLVNLLAAKEIKFYYKLKGVDKHWKSTKNHFSAIYSELPYGDFEFQVKIQDHPNLIKNNKTHIIKISIAKPFYLQTWFIIVCFAILLTWGYSYMVIKRNVKLLNQQQSIILKQKSLVEEKNQEIVDSITYAKRIQDAILPNNSVLDYIFKEFFVIYEPRDIVSGDFYWVQKQDEWIVFAAADCTGHGVPGAMVSMMCNDLLRKVIIEEGINDPGLVLDKVTELLVYRLQGNHEQVNDGMDIALCFWHPTQNILKFSGAHNPLYLLRNGNLNITKANKQPIGYFEDKTPFTTHEFELEPGDQIFLFSDGFKDQFGGPKNKKFGAKRFNQVLMDNAHLPLHEQKENIIIAFESWKQEEEQVDDICVFSVKF